CTLDRLSGQLPGIPLRAVEPAAGLGIAEELFLDRIPLERAIEPVGDVAQVGDGRPAVAELDVAEGALAGTHAVEEVADEAALALVVRDVDVRGLLLGLAAAGGDLAARALEGEDAAPAALVVDPHAVLEDVGEARMLLPVRRDHLHRAGLVEV